MQTRPFVALLAALPVNAVLFGAGAIAVLSVPALKEQASTLIPAVIVASFALTPLLAWLISRRMMLRFWPRPRQVRH